MKTNCKTKKMCAIAFVAALMFGTATNVEARTIGEKKATGLYRL